MKSLINSYIKARDSFIRAIDRFPQEKREAMLFDKWNLLQLIIHISGWDNCIADNIKCIKEGKEPPFYGTVDEYNSRSVEHGKGWSWAKAYKELITGGKRVVKEYETLDAGLWQAKFWKTKNSTPERFLKIVTKHYSHEHLPQILKIQ